MFAFGNRNGKIEYFQFTVNDFDRLVNKHSTDELDNRPFGTETIGVSLG